MTPAALLAKRLPWGRALPAWVRLTGTRVNRSWAISVSLAAPMVGGKTHGEARPPPKAARASPMSRRRSAPVAPIAGIAAPPMSQPGSHQSGSPGQPGRRGGPTCRMRQPTDLRCTCGSQAVCRSALCAPSPGAPGTSTPLHPGRYAGCPGAQALPLAGVGGSVLACRPSSQSGADVATTLL